MKRTVITVGGNGMLSIPSNLENLWMSEGELVDMLHVTAPKLNSVIRAIYKEGMLLMSKVQQRQELSKGIWQTLYGFPMVVAICFRLTSNGAAQLRDAIFKRLYHQISAVDMHRENLDSSALIRYSPVKDEQINFQN